MFNSNVGTQVEGSFRILTPDTAMRCVLGNSDDSINLFVPWYVSMHVDFYSVAKLQSGMTLSEDQNVPSL